MSEGSRPSRPRHRHRLRHSELGTVAGDHSDADAFARRVRTRASHVSEALSEVTRDITIWDARSAATPQSVGVLFSTDFEASDAAGGRAHDTRPNRAGLAQHGATHDWRHRAEPFKFTGAANACMSLSACLGIGI